MATDERPPDEGLASDALADLSRKLDTIAGALAAVAGSHTDLLAHVAEAEARRSHDAREMAQRLSALERQILELPTQAPPPPSDPLDPFPVLSVTADLEQLRSDVTLTLEVLAQVADAVERLDHRDGSAPGGVVTAGDERHDAQLTALSEAVASLRDEGPAPVREKLAELTAELVAVRSKLEATDVAGPLADVAEDLGGRIALHTDVALAGALRVIDDRLVALRQALTAAGSVAPANVGGFEAGAVMGAVQAAWTRLEQRLDSEFDDLGRQLQAMAALMEHTATIAEAAIGSGPDAAP